MPDNPVHPVCLTQITDQIGIATISKPPVNPLSSDVCAGLLEALGEFQKAHVLAGLKNHEGFPQRFSRDSMERAMS